MTGPLNGIRVIEFSEIIAGPLAGMLLSDLGADVIKVEPPWGDPWRKPRIGGPGEERVFIAINRGKRSVTLDLKNGAGRAAARRLLGQADVVISNYRPGVPAQLGIDYETVSRTNRRVVYCEVTAYGPDGPDSHLPGYDLIMQGYTGMISAEGKMQGGRPVPVVSTPAIDFATGHSMVASVCGALYSREWTGTGQKIETSLFANALLLQAMPLTRLVDYPSPTQAWAEADLPLLREAGVSYEDTNAIYQQLRVAPLYALYYRSYRTADSAIMVGCLSDPLRERLMGALGLHDPRFDPGYDASGPEYQEVIRGLIASAEALFSSRPSAAWIEGLTAAGVPVGMVRFPEEMTGHPQAIETGLIVEQKHLELGRVRTIGPITKMSVTPPEAVLPSPTLGQHTDEVLREIGYSTAEIAEMRRSGAMGSAPHP